MHWLNGAHSAPYLYRHATMKKAVYPLRVVAPGIILGPRLRGDDEVGGISSGTVIPVQAGQQLYR